MVIHPPGDSASVRYEEVERQRIVPLTGRGVSRYRTMSSSYRSGLDTVVVVRAEVRHWRPGRGEEEATVTTRPHQGLADADRLEASLREQVLSFGGMERLDTLVVETRRLIRRLPLADLYSYTFFAGGRDSVVSWSFSLTRPSGTPLLVRDLGAGSPEPAGRGNWETLRWRGGPVPPVPLLPMARPLRGRTPRVVVATHSPEQASRVLWGALRECLSADTAGAGQVLAEAGAASEELRRWTAAKVEYLGSDWGLYPGYSPRPPRQTLDSRAGVCRDKAVLLAWLLRAAGMDATLGLSSLSSQPDPLVGSRSFDHVVTLLRDGAGWRVLDPTYRGVSPYPYELRGRRCLPLTPEGSPMVAVPAGGDDTLLVRLSGELQRSGALRARLLVRADGAADQVLRSVARAVPPELRGEMLALLVGAEPDSSSISCHSPGSVDGPFEVRGSGLWRLPASVGEGGAAVVLPGAFDLDRLAGHQMTYAMVDGYLPDTLLPDPPVTLVTEVAVLLPGRPASLPEEGRGRLYSRECAMAGDSLRIREVVDLSPPEGPALAREEVAEAASMCRGPAGRTVVLQ
ncbi:MAG: transglutaminase-like domain-containing protein [Candidatus Fermentibacterota bacterium]